MNRGRWIYFLAFCWLVWGGLMLVLAVGVLPIAWWAGDRALLFTTAIASLVLSQQLFGRKPHARISATIAHFALAVGLLITALVAWEYDVLVRFLPDWLFDQPTWRNLIASLLILAAGGSLFAVYWLTRNDSWRDFKQKPLAALKNLCPTCAAGLDDGTCIHCQGLPSALFFLQPALANTKRILLQFDPSIDWLDIGRGVDNYGGRIDEENHAAYKGVSRRQAAFKYDFEEQTLTLRTWRTGLSTLINGKDIYRPTVVNVGDQITLNGLHFVLGDADFEPMVATWTSQLEPQTNTLMVFHPNRRQRWQIGRAADNDIVLAPGDISRQHAAIVHLPDVGCFVVFNSSNDKQMRLNGFDLPAGQSERIPVDEPSVIQLNEHNFVFTPIPYTP